MISAPNRVLIWQSQLAANEFPPVCAMTGQPAETWRKFTFRKTPPWAFWVGGVFLARALSERSSGYLPLTRSSVKKLRTVTWTFGGLIPLAFFLWAIGIVLSSVSSSQINSAIFWLLFLLGFGALFAGVIGLLIGRSAVNPVGKVLDRQPGYYESLIELRNVHPAFVAAVIKAQQARRGAS